jgi:cold-inducible RNA-binding protein
VGESTANLPTLYVAGFDAATDLLGLWRRFAAFGEIAALRVVRDPQTERPRGFAYVTFAEGRAAVVAQLALDGTAVGDRILRVAPAL